MERPAERSGVSVWCTLFTYRAPPRGCLPGRPFRGKREEGEHVRYASSLLEAFCWLVHDTLVHCVTGIVGFAGRITSIIPGTGTVGLRLITIAHHLHNATAPSNDVLSDHAHAVALACHNESPGNPTGTQTPDEWYHNRRRAIEVLESKGLSTEFRDADMLGILEEHDVAIWEGQASSEHKAPPPKGATRSEQVLKRRAKELERSIAERLERDRVIEDKRMLKILLDSIDEFMEAREKHELARVLRKRGITFTPGSHRAKKHTSKE